MLVNFDRMLREALVGHYAVGSFNVYNYETIKGVLDASHELEKPVIIALGAKYLENMSLESFVALVRSMASDTEMPVCMHLDHCGDMDIVYRAIKAGFGSVMYDGSALPFAENAAKTKAVCDVAHACGVTVEAELGSLAAGEKSHEGTAEDKQVYTDPDAAKEFVAITRVDALAVSVGTVHGLYKGEPNVRIDILKEINEALGIPLVLHGGSGTPEATIKECIANGITKINVNTEISAYAVERTTELLSAKQPHLSSVSLSQIGFVKEVVKKYVEFFS
jgi:fructose-bisphosphate aldolase class II